MAATRDAHALGAQAARLGSEGPGALGQWRSVSVILLAYVAVGSAAAGACLALGRDPASCEGALGAGGTAAALISVGLGICLGALTVAATRVMVRRLKWARALHAALRPSVRHAADGWLLALATASALAEELLFRGLLVPLLGVAGSALLFGALHQVRGKARWGWMLWAVVMGVLFGGLYVLTGSLAGPVVAHGIINAANLRFLRDTDPEARPRALGGLLRRA